MSSFTEARDAAILIVDDQESNVVLLERVLRRRGYDAVSSTTHPRTVCDLHRLNHFDLILLDLQMPGMSGFEVIEALRTMKESEDVAVLVLSADPSQRVRALQAGARDFLSKPLDLVQLLAHVAHLLEKTRAGGIALPLPPPATAPAPHVLI